MEAELAEAAAAAATTAATTATTSQQQQYHSGIQKRLQNMEPSLTHPSTHSLYPSPPPSPNLTHYLPGALFLHYIQRFSRIQQAAISARNTAQDN